MKQKIMDFIFKNGKLFDKIRNIIHDNYKDEKEIISKNSDRDKKTLDFGCGIGQFSVMFNQNNYYGVDLDEKYINFCKINYKGKFIKINNKPPYNFDENFFDQILISAVIHHIDDKTLITIMKELKRILDKKGNILIIDHFTKENQKNLFCKFLIFLDRGKYFRNSKNVTKLLSKEFEVKNIQTFRNGPYKDYIITLKKFNQVGEYNLDS